MAFGTFTPLWLDTIPPLTTAQTISSSLISSTIISIRPSSIKMDIPVLTSLPPSKSRSLISGPFVSNKVATGRFNSPLTLITLANFFLCSSCVPWEKLKRATSIPANINSFSFSSLSLAGPIVQIIFVFLILALFLSLFLFI